MGKHSSIQITDGETGDLPFDASESKRPRSRGPTPHRATRAVGYLRRSTDRQEQSIPDQKRAVERYAEENGLRLLRCYVDDAISGTSTIGRKAFQQMMADAAAPGCDFSVVVVYDVKRFGRVGNDEAGYYRHLLRQSGVEVHYASEGFTGDGTDDLLRPVKQWQARQESKDLAKVAIRGLVSKATIAKHANGDKAGGFWMGGAPPFGFDLCYESQSGQFLFFLRYERDGTKQMLNEKGEPVRILARGESIAVSKRDRCTLVPSDKERVKTVKLIFRLYVEERKGLKAIADHLNRKGVPTARGPEWSGHYSGQWAMTTVRAILLNPAYSGDLAWNRRTDARFFRIAGDGRAIERKAIGGKNGRRLEPNDEADWLVTQDAHPALVPRRVFHEAKALMQQAAIASAGDPTSDQRVTGGWTGPRSRFLLSGLIRCAHCQSRYEGCIDPSGAKPKDGSPRAKCYCYACGGYIRRGRSVCKRGAVPQAAIEEAVIRAVLKAYEPFTGDHGRKALAGAVGESIGSERERAIERGAEIEHAINKLELTTRNLLDNITAGNRAAVDARLKELQRERELLEHERDELEHASLGREEIKALIDDTARFVACLDGLLKEGAVNERQAAIRRCVESINYDRDTGRAKLHIRRVPIVMGGAKSDAQALCSVQIAVKA